jgi:hypothetical protein
MGTLVEAFRVPAGPVPRDYPSHLAGVEPERTTYRRATALLAGLVLLCLALRGWMAGRIPGVSPDSVLYIRLAKSLEAGDLRDASAAMSVNTLPLILMVLHRAGLDWELAGMLWGVGISSLVVLPLFGWVRREFDDRVAALACLLYAVQPKMIAWSPEIMRDPTFWFLFTLSLYLMWRAIAEVRVAWFVAAGLSVALACLTRFEGAFLFLPLGLWAFWRGRALAAHRKKLVLGVAACIAVLPLVVLAANLVWRCSSGDWVLPRLAPLARVQTWLASSWGTQPGPMAPTAAPLSPSTVPPAAAPPSLGQMLWVFFPTMTRGLSPAFALLMLGGLWGWRRTWARRDHQALFCVALLVMAGIWVQYWYDRLICPRYALPIVLMASPFAALGLLGLTAWLRRMSERLRFGARLRVAVAAAPLAAVCLLGVGDAMTCNRSYFALRQRAVLVGHWLQERAARPPTLVGPAGITQVVGYYAQGGDLRTFRLDNDDPLLVVEMVSRFRPDVLLLHPTRGMRNGGCESLVARMRPLGLEPADLAHVSEGPEPLYVLARGSGDRVQATEPGRVGPAGFSVQGSGFRVQEQIAHSARPEP